MVIEALAEAFKSAGLKFLNLAAVKDDAVSAKLEAFKAGEAGQVLLLNMDSETSAGSNLTIANHVIFANPYVHPDREHPTGSTRPGRCDRRGVAASATLRPRRCRCTTSWPTAPSRRRCCASSARTARMWRRSLKDFPRPWWLEDEDE